MYITNKTLIGKNEILSKDRNNKVFDFFVNFSQKLHDGVIKDIELQKIRKVENTYNLQKQQDITKQLKKEFEETKNNT